MGETKAPANSLPEMQEAWSSLQSAFARWAEDAVRKAASANGRSGSGSEAIPDMRKTVTEAISAVLLETSIVDRLVDRHLKVHPNLAKGAGGETSEEARQEVARAVRGEIGGSMQAELQGIIHKELKSFLTSMEFKELIDEKFRSITLYLKSDVIPRAVREVLTKSES